MFARVVPLALLFCALIPASADAHATIVRTTPADQAVLKTQPREVSLEFSERVDLGAHAIRLLDGSGEEVKTAAAKPGPGGPSTAVLTLPPGLAKGTYVVAWRVVSSDSHPVSGAFSFSVGAPSQVVFESGGSSSATVRTIDAIGRGLAFLGLALALGGALVVFVLSSAAPARGRQLVLGGVGALLAGSVI